LGQYIYFNYSLEFYENNRIFIPTDKQGSFVVDLPIFDCKYVYHEKGLRILDEKLGCFFIFFKDMKFIRITKTLKN